MTQTEACSARVLVCSRVLACVCVLAGITAQITWPAHAQDVMVFAAASLRNALDDVSGQYGQRVGKRVSISYAASSALARQIERGAPADVFISADLDWMDYVAKRNLIKSGSRFNLLRNEIVLIAPAGSAARIAIKPGLSLVELLGKGRLAMADPDYVPAGKYARSALEKLGAWRSVASRIARGENVRAALNFVSRGEAPLGIVYRTDAAADPNVRIVAVFPPETHPPIVYPAALLKAGKSPDAAKFFEFLKSGAAAKIFSEHGFVPY